MYLNIDIGTSVKVYYLDEKITTDPILFLFLY